jgi:hypothetical protein
MVRDFIGYIGKVALFGAVLFYLTYVGAFKASTYDSMFSYGRSSIDAVVVNLQLPCDRLMNVGMGEYCRVFYDDGVSVRIAPVSEEFKLMYPDQQLMSCADGASEFKQSLEHVEAWQKRAMVKDQVELRCILTSDA